MKPDIHREEGLVKAEHVCQHGVESMVMFDAAQRAIEDTRVLINDLAKQSAGQRGTPE